MFLPEVKKIREVIREEKMIKGKVRKEIRTEEYKDRNLKEKALENLK